MRHHHSPPLTFTSSPSPLLQLAALQSQSHRWLQPQGEEEDAYALTLEDEEEEEEAERAGPGGRGGHAARVEQEEEEEQAGPGGWGGDEAEDGFSPRVTAGRGRGASAAGQVQRLRRPGPAAGGSGMFPPPPRERGPTGGAEGPGRRLQPERGLDDDSLFARPAPRPPRSVPQLRGETRRQNVSIECMQSCVSVCGRWLLVCACFAEPCMPVHAWGS